MCVLSKKVKIKTNKLSWGLHSPQSTVHTFKVVPIIILILTDRIAILSQFSSRYIRNYIYLFKLLQLSIIKLLICAV